MVTEISQVSTANFLTLQAVQPRRLKCILVTSAMLIVRPSLPALWDEVIPMLRKQKGFTDEITLVAAERNEVIAISFWDRREDAEVI